MTNEERAAQRRATALACGPAKYAYTTRNSEYRAATMRCECGEMLYQSAGKLYHVVLSYPREQS